MIGTFDLSLLKSKRRLNKKDKCVVPKQHEESTFAPFSAELPEIYRLAISEVFSLSISILTIFIDRRGRFCVKGTDQNKLPRDNCQEFF